MYSEQSKSIFTANEAAEQLSIPVRTLQRYATVIGAGQRVGGGSKRGRYVYSEDDLSAIRVYRDSMKVKLAETPRRIGVFRPVGSSKGKVGATGKKLERTTD